MKKKVVYSLMAAAVVPGAAHADALLKDAVDVQKWTGTDAVLNGAKTKILSNSGETITYSLGKKAQGTYKLNIADIVTDESALTVSVGGKSVTVAAKGNKAEVEFTLASEADVTITVSSADKKYFELGASTLTLVYDFTAAKATIQAALTKATNAVNAYTNSGKTTQVAKFSTIQKEVNRLKDDLTDGNDSYAAYVEYELWKDIDENNALMKQIKTQAVAAAKEEWTYLIGNTDTKFKTTQANFDKLPAYAKKNLQKAYDDIVAAIAAYKTSAAGDDADEFDGTNKNNEINTAIDNLNNEIAKVGPADEANENSWTEFKTNVTTAKGTYLSDIVTVLKDAEGQVFSYANLLTAGRAVISDKLAKMTQLQDEAEASYNNGTLVADRNDAKETKGYDSRLTNLEDELKAAYNLYATTLKAALGGFEAEYATQLKVQTDAEKTYKDVIAKHTNEHNALKAAVAAVKAAIDEANSGDCTALQTLDLTEEKDAVTEASAGLVKACAAEQDKVDAVAKANEAIETLESDWAKDKAAIDKLKYGETLVSSFFAVTEKTINDKIATEKKTTETKNADAKTEANDPYYTTTQGENIDAIKQLITKYKTEATAAANIYKTVSENLEKARKALAEAKAKVEKLDIYTDNTQNEGGYDYKASVEEAEKEIKAVDDAIAKANNLKDYKNTDAVKALTFDDTKTNAVVAHINTYADTDQKAWQADADKKALAAQRTAVQDLQSGLKTDKSNVEAYTDEQLGNAAAEVKSKLTAIEIPDDKDVTEEALNALSSEKLTELLDKLSKAREDMDVVVALAKEAADRVVANNQAKTDAEAAVAALKWKDSEVSGAAGDAYTTGTNKEKAEVDALIKDINDALTAVNKAINDAYAAENLKSEYAATIEAQVKQIKTDIDAAKKTAESLKKNYNSFAAVKAYATENVDIDAAIAKAKAADAAAGDSYFAQTVLAKTYADELKGINDDNAAQYKAKTAATAEKGLKERIDALKKKVDAVEADAKTNLEKYKAQQELEGDVTKTWNDKSVELASGNESSLLAEQQKELDALLDALNEQIAKDKADYEKGLAATNDAANTAALNKIKKDITDLVEKAMEGYNEQIAKDNAATLNAIAAAKKAAEGVYKAATETVNAYKNLKSESAKAALAAVQNAYDDVVDALYNAPTNLNKIWSDAQKEYNATTSPTVFDKEGNYVDLMQKEADAIKTAEDNFIAKVQVALANTVGAEVKKYEDAITAAKAVTEKYTESPTYQSEEDKVFDELDKLVATARTAVDADVPVIKDIDEAMLALANFDADLLAAKDKAAYYDLKGYLEDQYKTVSKAEAYFADDAAGLANYNAYKKNTLDKAQEKFDESEHMSNDYEEIKNLIDNYKNNNPYAQATANDSQYNSIVADIVKMQEYLDAAIESVKDYGCIEELKTQDGGFNAQQTDIENKTTAAKKAKEDGTAKYNENDLKNFMKAVYAIVADANVKTAEYKFLEERIKDLKAEYNRYAATASAEDLEAEKKAIDDLVAAIEKDKNDTKKKAADLQKYEAQIKAELAKLVEANDGAAGQDAYRAALTSSIDEVAAKAVFADDVNADVKAEYQEQMDALVAEINAVKAEIAASENPAYDTDRIESEIAALGKKVDALVAEIAAEDKTVKAAIAANTAAYEAAQKNIDALTKLVTDSKAKLDKYTDTNAQSGKFASKYKLIEDKIAKEQANLDELYAAGKAATYGVSLDENDDVMTPLAEIEDAAAYRQITSDFKNLEAKYTEFDALQVDASLYLPSDIKKINAAKEDIKNRIYGTYVNGKLTKDGLEQTIAKDLTNATSGKNYEVNLKEVNDLLDKIEETTELIKSSIISPEGDVNGDGVVNGLDIQEVIKGIVEDSNDANLDINGDGKVNGLDIQKIINFILGR